MIKAVARLAIVVAAVASAIWLAPASVHIASWPGSGPVRVAFMPPLGRFWFVLAGVAILAALTTYTWTARGHALEKLATHAAPLSLLLLWSVPFAPWLADRAPALLLFAGPMRWAVLAVAVGGVTAAAFRADWFTVTRADRRVIFAAAFAVYGVMGVRFAHQVGYNGDSPHYLVITHSLLVDRDLDIANNHERRDYAAFFPGDLSPDFLRRGRHEEIYSIHAPGLPALLVPAYAAGGALGAVILIAALGALTSVAVFDLAAVLAGTGPALITWAAVCFSVPFVPHAWLIYPEMACALIVARAVLWLWQPIPSVGRAAIHGALLAMLPWLHTKFAVFLAFLTLFELLRLWPRARHLAAFLAPIAVSSVLWLFSFYWMYGVFDPQAPYGSYTQLFVVARNIPRSFLGLLFDQKFGLLVFSPIYILIVAGVWLLLRATPHRAAAAGLLLTAVVFVASTSRMYMWWGGSSAPARFLVPIVPLLAPFVAVAIARLDRPFGRALVVSTVVMTLAITAITAGSARERLLYSPPHGLSMLFEAVQGAAPLNLLLPTFTEENWRGPLAVLWPWLAGLTVAIVITMMLVRRGAIQSSYWASVTSALLLITVAGVTAARPAPAVRAAAAMRGQQDLLAAYDPSRLHPIDVTRAVRLSDSEVRALVTLDLQRQPLTLPEGKYQAQLWFDGSLARTGDATITAGDAVIARVPGALRNPLTVPFELPVSATVDVRTTDPVSNDALRRVQIAAMSVVPRSARVGSRSVVVESIERGLLAYADGNAYPEHGSYWTRGTEESTVVVATPGARELRLILHVGPTGGPVDISVGEKKLRLDLKPDETREFPIALPPGASKTAVSIRASRAFIPAELDRANADRRSLGCQVRPVLF